MKNTNTCPKCGKPTRVAHKLEDGKMCNGAGQVPLTYLKPITKTFCTSPLSLLYPEHEELLDTSYLQLRFALENSKVNIDFSSEPYTCTLNIPLQKDGSRQWNATLFINSQKDQQKLIEKLESTLKAKFILNIKDFKESDSNISQPKKQLNLYEQELQYDLQLQILQEKFAPIWITSNKQITKLETNPEQTEIEDS